MTTQIRQPLLRDVGDVVPFSLLMPGHYHYKRTYYELLISLMEKRWNELFEGYAATACFSTG